MSPETALFAIEQHANDQKAAEKAAYMKIDRRYMGVSNEILNDLTKQWRQELEIHERVEIAAALWKTDIFEARVAAAKLLTQARIRPDVDVWHLLTDWVKDFDCWAIADHACMAGQKRLIADITRLDTVETWTTSEHMWTKRAALVITLPWTKQNHPKQIDLEIRDRVLGWAATYVNDPDWFIQKAVAWWVRDLSKHDPARSKAFIDTHGDAMKPFARKEALRHLTKS